MGDNTTKLIPVDAFVVDFDEDGGSFKHQPTGDVYTYAEADHDFETITLSAGLPTGKTLTAGDALHVVDTDGNKIDDLYADVAVDDVAGDTVACRVPQGLRNFLPEGNGAAGQVVRVDAGGEGWELVEMVGGAPIIDLPRVKLVKGNGTSTNGVEVSIGWDSADVDTENAWTSGAFISVNRSGQWLISVTVNWATAAAGNRQVTVESSTDGGTNWTVLPTMQSRISAVDGDPTPNNMSNVADLTAGMLLRVRRKPVGASPDATSARFSMVFVGEA